MASATAVKLPCAACETSAGIFTCGGCEQVFCTKHANEHRELLGKEMDEIVLERDQLRESMNEQENGNDQCSSMKEIDEWEEQSIRKLKQIAGTARQKLKELLTERTQRIRTTMQELTEKLSTARIDDDFVETDLKQWMDKINELKTSISISIPIIFKNINEDLIQFSIDQYPQDDSPPRLIELQKSGGSFGFKIMGGRENKIPIFISSITSDGVAWKHGGLKKGDQLLFVNDVSVENEYHDKVVELIKQAQGNVRLIVRYLPQVFTEMDNRLKEQ